MKGVGVAAGWRVFHVNFGSSCPTKLRMPVCDSRVRDETPARKAVLRPACIAGSMHPPITPSDSVIQTLRLASVASRVPTSAEEFRKPLHGRRKVHKWNIHSNKLGH